MDKSKLNLMKKVEAHLFLVPEMVTGFQKKQPGIVTRFTNWLTTAEKLLKENNLPICSEMSGLRSKLLHSGMVAGPAKKKQQYTTSLEIMQPAQSILQEVITPIKAKVDQSKQVLQQTVTLAYNTGLIRDQEKTEFNTWVNDSWKSIRQNEQLSAGIINAVTLVGHTDAYVLFAEQLMDFFSDMHTSPVRAMIA